MAGTNGNGVEVEAPGGWRGRVFGTAVIPVVLSSLLAVGLIYIVDKAQEAQVRLHRDIVEHQAELANAQQEIILLIKNANEQNRAFQDGVVYVLSLPQAERERLRLQMPESIRRLERRPNLEYNDVPIRDRK